MTGASGDGPRRELDEGTQLREIAAACELQSPERVAELVLDEVSAALGPRGMALYVGDDREGLRLTASRHLPGAVVRALAERRQLGELEGDALDGLERGATERAPGSGERICLKGFPLAMGGRVVGLLVLATRRTVTESDGDRAQRLALCRSAFYLDHLRLARAAGERLTSVSLVPVAESRLRILIEASELLSGLMAPDEALTELANLVVARMADYCVTYGYDGREITRVGLAHRDPARQRLVRQLGETGSPRVDDEYGAGAVIRTGAPVLVRDVSADLVERTVQSREQLRAVRDLRPHSSMIVPLTARGRTLGAIAFALTDPERRKYDDADLRLGLALGRRAALLIDNLRLYADARRAIELRDELVAIVSHDLRSPLATISSAVEVARLHDGESGRRRALTAIRRAVDQMDGLTRDLLDVSRLEANELTLSSSHFDANVLLLDAVRLFEDLARRRRVSLTRSPDPSSLPVFADRRRLLQVVCNLLDNAIRHAPSGGHVELSSRARGELVELCVENDGPPIPPELHERLFERFWQGGPEPRGGGGLGLAIARGIVESHGGRITVTNAQRGPAFRFSLPVAPQGEAASSGEAPSSRESA